MRRRIYEILEVAGSGDWLSRGFDVFVVTLIALNVVAMVLESVDACYRVAPRFFVWFEMI